MPAPLNEEQRNKIIKLRKENKTQKEIADKVGVHEITVSKFLREKGMGGRSDPNHTFVTDKPKRKTELVNAPSQGQPPPLPEQAEGFPGSDTMVGKLSVAIRLLQEVIQGLEKIK